LASVAVVSFFWAVAGAAAFAGSAFFSAACAGFAAGVSSTVADAFSSVAGAVDSAGEADSSWAKVIPARKTVVMNEIIIFMSFSGWASRLNHEPARIVFGRLWSGQGLSRIRSNLRKWLDAANE